VTGKRIHDGLTAGQRFYRNHVNPSPRPHEIQDEYTDRIDLTAQQKFGLRRRKGTEWWKNQPEWKRIEKNTRRHGLTYLQVVALFEAQKYKCFLCGAEVLLDCVPNSILRGVIDHDHNTGELRKILCHHCNRALGLVKENKDILQRMIDYV
jgi:DNA-directed RNA polymerase subunit RPC12/RpoP